MAERPDLNGSRIHGPRARVIRLKDPLTIMFHSVPEALRPDLSGLGSGADLTGDFLETVFTLLLPRTRSATYIIGKTVERPEQKARQRGIALKRPRGRGGADHQNLAAGAVGEIQNRAGFGNFLPVIFRRFATNEARDILNCSGLVVGSFLSVGVAIPDRGRPLDQRAEWMGGPVLPTRSRTGGSF